MKKNYFLLLACFSSLFSLSQNGAHACLDFSSGIKYVEIPHNTALNPSTNISVEAWIYAKTFGNTSWINSIVSTDRWTGGNGEEGYVLRCGDGGKLSFNIASTTSSWKEVISPAVLGTNKWHHVVGTYNGSVLKVYVDGEEVGSSNFSGTIKVSTGPLRIGRMAESAQTREFDGSIEEVRIWNQALSLSDIRSRMCQTLNGNETGLVAYYPMDEFTGTTTADKSSNSFNGTLSTPAPTWEASTAHVGDTAVYAFPANWTGTTLSIAHMDGDSMTLSNVTGTPDGMFLYHTDGAHLDTTPPVNHFSLMNKRYWGVFQSGSSQGHQIDYNFNGYPGVISANALKLAYKSGTGLWKEATTTTIGTNISYPATGSKQYILSSSAPQVVFGLKSPADSSQLVLQGWSAQTATFKWQNPGLKSSERFEWHLDKVTGSFNPSQVNQPSNNGGKDSVFTISYAKLDSLLNFISMPQGHTRYYKWTVKTQSGLEATEPRYIEITRGTLRLREVPVLEEVKVYPTLVDQGQLKIENLGLQPIKGTVEIIDRSGQTLISSQLNSNASEVKTLDVNQLPPGNYFVKVNCEYRVVVEPISILSP